MTWQKWLIRGLVCAVLAAVAAGAALYALWTSPSAIRLLVQEKLGVRFLGVGVQVGSARLRLLGGIQVSDLRLDRSDSIDRRDFLYVPSAVIHHDKEQMLDGKVAIRRVELHAPQLRVVRGRDGRFNVAGILGPVDLSERMPTIVITDGSLVFEDLTSSSSPLVEVHGLQMTMINDPLPVLQFEGSGTSDILGPVRFRASVPRATLAATVEFEFPAVPIDAGLMKRLAGALPDAAQLGPLTGVGRVTAKLQLPDSPEKKLTHDVTFELKRGRCAHPLLPRPLERIEASARLIDGVVPSASLTAAFGAAAVEARAVDVRLPASAADLAEPLALVGEIDASVKRLHVDEDVLSHLPGNLPSLKEEYAPAGPCSVGFRYRRAAAGRPLVKEWAIEAHGMAGSFVEFPVPVREVFGTVWLDVSAAPRRNIKIDVRGLACDKPATLRGTIRGEKGTSETLLDVAAKDVKIDDRIERAVPQRVREIASQFYPALSRKYGLAAYPMGEGDVTAQIRRAHGEAKSRKTFKLTFRKTAVLYDKFPLPLENVSGVLTLYPDHWEAEGFHGTRSGGSLFLDGKSVRLEGKAPGSDSPLERVDITIKGKDILLDKEWETALVPASGKERLELQAAWRRLRLTGRLSFAAFVSDIPGQPQDIDVSARVDGCSIRPAFFDYQFEQLGGQVRYAKGMLELTRMTARHGRAEFALSRGVIKLGGEAGFFAWLRGLSAKAVPPDADFLRALPESLRNIAEPLRLKSPIDLNVRELDLDATGGASQPMKVWWKGGLGLKQASLKAGIELNDATGELYCEGYHNGRQLAGVKGRFHIERATMLGQPLTNASAELLVEGKTPEALQVRSFQAGLFGGHLVGEARLETSPRLKYDVDLKAIGVQLELVGRHNLPDAGRKAQLQGAAGGGLYLTGEGSDLTSLKGSGRLDVPEGKMGQLPVLLDLIKAFGLRVPDRTAFEQAHMAFAIEGPRVVVNQLDLYGNAISLRGAGAVDLDGSRVNLDFQATPGRMTQILPAGLDAIPQAVSGQILKIKMRGKVGGGGDIKFEKEFMPGVVEPIRRAIGGS